jgi:hypothetical protein
LEKTKIEMRMGGGDEDRDEDQDEDWERSLESSNLESGKAGMKSRAIPDFLIS